MDKYQRVKVLGKGSFGSAILIKRKSDGLLFVVKEVAMTRMSRKEREEARHECTVLQQLQHPNIVRYVEQFENNNNLYIVMEYCDGGDLSEKMKQSRGPMKESSMLYYFSQICLAIEYLHARHILHRDIKTMNVFLMKNGAVKLGDFGISTVLRTTMGMANTVCGTPYYFSPELCRNRPYNNKSDIWALGVLLYECATGGRHPFDGTSMNQLMQRIVQGHYAPLSSQYSSEFRKMVDWCLQKDPARRPSIKQTLALPLMRRSLEQLEEDLMLATQCRVRLKDIIDFEGGVDQERKGSSPQPSPKRSPRAAAKGGVSPGQAAALAMAHHNLSPVLQQPTTPSHSPMASPGRGGGAPAALGPKPSAAAQQSPMASPKQGKDAHRLYSPCQKKPITNPLLPGGGARLAPVENPSSAATPLLAQRPLEEPTHTPPLRIKIPVGGGGAGDRRGLAAGALPAAAAAPVSGASPKAVDPLHVDMRRVDAIIARYGRNADEKAKETIHAYMRRKHEAYLKQQKEELEARERRNKMRKEELRRVLDHQRMAASPVFNNECHNSPKLNNANVNGCPDNRSPRRSSPHPRAKPDNVPIPALSPPSSPSHNKEPISARTPTSAEPAVFGRDPRRGAPHGEPVSRPTTPRQNCMPQQPPSPAAAAPNGNPLPQTPPRRVVYAANSPQQALPLPQHRTEVPEARRAVTPEPLHSPSSRVGAPRATALNIDRRSVPNSKPEAAVGGQKAPLTADLGGGINGHRMVLQQNQQYMSQPRRSMDEEQLQPAHREKREPRALEDAKGARRPSVLSPISGDLHEHLSPCQAAAAAPERVSPSSRNNRPHRPGRAPQRYLKPLGGRGEDGLSPVTSPKLAKSPRCGAAGAEHGRRGSSGVPPPVKSKALVSAGTANPPSLASGERADSTCTAAPSRAQANPCTPVKAALCALRSRAVREGAPAPPPSSAMGAEMKDLPAINMASPEYEHPARRNHQRYILDEAALYRGMGREPTSREEKRLLEDEHRKQHHTEVSAVPNTLEALRSLRLQQDKAMEAEGVVKEGANLGGQLALLKQRHRMQQRPRQSSASSSASVPLAPQLITRAAKVAASPKSELPSGYGRKTPMPRANAAARSSAAHVTALSLGDISRGTASSQEAPPPIQAGVPSSPNHSPGGGGGARSSMEGYAEMLQHLKDLLQRRRCPRAGGESTPASPTTAASAPSAIQPQRDRGTRSPTSKRNRPLPPPLNPSPLGGGDMSCASDSGGSGGLMSPPKLEVTRPLHPQPNAAPLVNIHHGCDAGEDDDEDFEDAIPLSPVRCAELNDDYVRRQDQREQNRHHAQEDVYTSDVDLTSAVREEELEGEEGYTDYHKQPSSTELLKGIHS
ncbi:protein kinase, putative [Leishmania tarentolae]|uniref:non-specific serine/threonine protein kinase n=1 Tax=Leishmania tarentolae TaxID=5689 RepID=A0A640KNT0_LEITA|nr:protein kinase, putative [Leishmania tarentolae]